MKHCLGCLALASILLLAACGPSKPEPPKPKEDRFPWNASLKTEPGKPQMNKPVSFQLTLLDEAGKPVTGAQVRGSLVMPLMDMGKNEFSFTEKGNGIYEGSGKMDMAGPWDLVVTAKANALEGQKNFSLRVEE